MDVGHNSRFCQLNKLMAYFAEESLPLSVMVKLKKKNYHRGGKITKYEIDCFSSMLHIVRNMYLYNQSLFFLYKADCDHVIVDFILTVSPWV